MKCEPKDELIEHRGWVSIEPAGTKGNKQKMATLIAELNRIADLAEGKRKAN